MPVCPVCKSTQVVPRSVGRQAGGAIGGVAGAVWALRKPDPNPNGLLARKPE